MLKGGEQILEPEPGATERVGGGVDLDRAAGVGDALDRVATVSTERCR